MSIFRTIYGSAESDVFQGNNSNNVPFGGADADIFILTFLGK